MKHVLLAAMGVRSYALAGLTALAFGCGSSPGSSADAGGQGSEDAAVIDSAAPVVDGGAVDGAAADASGPGDDAALPIADAGIADAAPTATDANIPPSGALKSPPYLMWVTESEVSVRWETENAVIGYVDYGTSTGFGQLVVEPAAVTSHEVRLTNMQPGQQYHYRIGWDGYGLPAKTFRTAPGPGDTTPCTFIVWGDNQNGPNNFDQLTFYMDLEDPAFAVSSGDCVQNGTRSEYRSQLFEPITSLADHVPFLVGAGNHERYSDSGAALFNEYMSQPGSEHCFGWRYGGVYFMFIDTELPIDPGTDQGNCIANGLSSAECRKSGR